MKNNIGWIIAGIIVLVIIFSCFLSNKQKKKDSIDEVELMSGKHNVVINIKNYGEIALELDADIAPITVTNFIYLVRSEERR